MATIDQIREVDDFGVEFHEDTREAGYRFTKQGHGVVIERTEETEFRHMSARMITPFRDLAHAYDVTGNSPNGNATSTEWDRRRRMLADTVDTWLDGLGLRTDRKDAHRCWTDESTPHLICRYSEAFLRAVNGSDWKAPAKFLGLGRGFDSDRGIAAIGNVVMDETLEDLARKCAVEGMGLTEHSIHPNESSFLVVDLDRSTLKEGGFSDFKGSLEEAFRLW